MRRPGAGVGGTWGSVGAVSTVAKGHSRNARGLPVLWGTREGVYAARGVAPASSSGL